MMLPKVKVCGITRLMDARAATKIGADYLGFIFYRKSPRYLSPAAASEIITALPVTVTPVGVFVNEPVAKVLSTARRLRLPFIQLSGVESVKDIRTLQRNGLYVIKTIHVKDDRTGKSLKLPPADIIQYDYATDNNYGGTGKTFDWSCKLPKVNNLMLSGGLNKNNVVEGIQKFRPMIVDVNSGVETSPGIKSARKIRLFMNQVRKVLNER